MMDVDYQPPPQPPAQADRPVVVNDVLCFVCNYRRQIDSDRLRRLLCEHFSADAVAHAESLLGQFVPEEVPSVAADSNNPTPDRLLDLFDRCSDAGDVPVFAASDLRALPLCLRVDDEDDGDDEPINHALVLREIRHLKRLIIERGWLPSAAHHHHPLLTSPPTQRSTSTALNVDTFPTPAKSDKMAALSASSPESPPTGTGPAVRKKSEATSGVKLDAAVKRLADRQKASVSSNGGGGGAADKTSPTAAAAAPPLDDRQKEDDAAPLRKETVERRASGGMGEERIVEHLSNAVGLIGAAQFPPAGWPNCYTPALAGSFDPAMYMGIFRQWFMQQQQQQSHIAGGNGLFPIIRPPASDPSPSIDFKEELASPTPAADGSLCGGSRSDSRQRKSSRDDDDEIRMLDTEKSNSSGGDSPSPSDTSNRDEAGYSLRDVAQDAVDKPFECQHANCHKRFANKFLLKKHEFIHTGERPHQCPYCGKRFNRKDNLLRHKKTHLANALANAKRRHTMVFGGGNRHQPFMALDHPLAAFGSTSAVDAIKLAAESSSAAAFARSLSANDGSLTGDD